MFKIVKNEERKSITLILKGARVFNCKYLLEKFEGKRYFGNALLNWSKDDFRKIVVEISKNLNEVNPSIEVKPNMLVSGDYPFISQHLDANKEEVENQYDVSLGTFAKNDKNFFFGDLSKDNPLAEENEVKYGEFALEIEINSNEKDGEVKIYTNFHRAVRTKKIENTNSYQQNDSAWEGFDLSTSEEVVEEDLPW